jgi:stage V sporulation protein R
MSTPLFTGTDWTFELIEVCLNTVEKMGQQELGMSLYPNQVEIISSDQMLDAYSSIGLPVMYNHWSYGKRLVVDEQRYRRGQMGLAYEIICNSNPAIAYLMEENTMMMQLLVLAHASVGHNFCFANNYLFKQYTDADSIVDYLLFAKKYVLECEQKYGVDEVERTLDSAHALQNLGVDKYRRAPKLNARKEEARLEERLTAWEQTQTELWYALDPHSQNAKPKSKKLLAEPEENILYFLEKNSPILKPWQREILRIVRKTSTYFHPQRMTKTVNEGIATFTHHWILNQLYDRGQLSDGQQLEWISSHSNVIFQPTFDDKRFSGINPYALGFAIFKDIQRICTNPTEEDHVWFPLLVHQDWKSCIREAATNYRDDSFIAQFLSPRVARDLKLFGIVDNKSAQDIVVNAIHDEASFPTLRTQLAAQYDLSTIDPHIVVVDADLDNTRTLKLEHHMVNERHLDNNTKRMMQHVKTLWGFPVNLRSVNRDGLQMFQHTIT